ncbi:MAG: beta-galactosidase [Anaerolineae bacterium]
MIFFGADYYPEQWDETRWETDAQLMQEAGFNVVRLAEFAWSMLEPADGVFEFAWLDRAIQILAARGIRVVLGTPSASVPPWLWNKIVDLALVDENGVPRTYGSRRDTSPTNRAYREHAVRIATRMAEHYRDNLAVMGWQIDNELGDRCYSIGTQREFQAWLCRKYGSLEHLNACWGTRFWSHVYTDWSQIPVPRRTATGPHNPGLHLDYDRFMSEVIVEFQNAQVGAIRAIVPEDQFVTHNFTGFSHPVTNYFDLANTLDFVTWDNYPRGFWVASEQIDPVPTALSHTMMRSLKQKNFWVMEQQSGHGAWTIIPPVPRPGEIALWAWQSIAYGADGIVFFRWRPARFGAEQFWHGILEHDGTPRRRYREVAAMGRQLREIGEDIAGSMWRSDVAILFSHDSQYAFQIQPTNPDLSYHRHVQDYFAAFHRLNISVDVVSPYTELDRYQLVVVPALYVADGATVGRLRTFAEAGGVVVVTARSGVKDLHNAIVDQTPPGLLRDLCGIEIVEYDSPLAGVTYRVESTTQDFPIEGHAAVWCDVLQSLTADVVATYGQAFYADTPVVTINRVGKGHVIYVGTFGDQALVSSIVHVACQLSGMSCGPETPAGVEAVSRWKDDGQRLLFLLNHCDEVRSVSLAAVHRDLITGDFLPAQIELAPKQVVIVTHG